LQLTPEQAKYWPPVEDAIRARAEARYRRLAAIKERSAQDSDIDLAVVLRNRADALTERAANLKKLVDAWQPLDQSLTPAQKQRARVVAGLVVRQMRGAADRRRMGTYDEDNDEG
jgi:ribonuclease D